MSKLQNGLLAAGLALGWLGCGDEIHYHGSDAAKGDPGPTGGSGPMGAKGDQGDPGAPATTNDSCNAATMANAMGCFRPIGQLQGVVYDQYDHRPIAGAKVVINYAGMAQTVTTGADGTYSFANLPANAGTLPMHAVGGPATWTGAYSVLLDLSGVMDTDHHYRNYQERKASVVFTALGDGESSGGSDQNTDTRVDGLVANLDFPVRQTRAALSANVYNAENRQPMANIGFVLTYQMVNAMIDNQTIAGQVAASGTTDAMGHLMLSGFEEGATYKLNPIDMRYGFSGNGTTYAGTNFYGLENGVVQVLADILLQDMAGRDNVAPYVVSVVPGDESVLLAGAALDQSITVTFSEAMDTTKQANLATALYWGLNASGDRTFPCRGVGAAPLTAASGEWTPVGGTMSPASLVARCRTLQEVFTIATWDAAGMVLTVDPQTNFVPGLAYAYRLDLHNGLLTDLAGNPRTGMRPASQTTNAGDAFQAGAGYLANLAPDSIVFTIQAGASVLTVDACAAAMGVQTGLCQIPNTADNQPFPGRETRENIIERLKGPATTPFRDLQRAGMFRNDPILMGAGVAAGLGPENAAQDPGQQNASSQAYVTWTPVAGAVAYVLYFRSALYPNAQPLQVIGGGAPPRIAINVSVALVNAIMGMIYPNNPNTPIDESFIALNTGWDNNLAFELGLAAVNVDGTEGPIQFVSVHDNTSPEVAVQSMAKPLGADYSYINGGAPGMGNPADSINLTTAQWLNCINVTSVTAANRVSCLAGAVTGYHGLLATTYGQGTVLIQLSEKVAASSVTTGNMSFVPGFVRNDVGNTTDPNGTEPEPTIVAVAPVAVSEGKTDVIAVTLSNIFSVDSGDTIQLTGATGAITDLAGNVAAAATSSGTNAEAPSFKFIDSLAPMIKSVVLTPGTGAAGVLDTVAITFTKRLFVEDDMTATNGNYNPALVSFTTAAGAVPGFFQPGRATAAAAGATIQNASITTSAGGEDTVTFQYPDISWLQHNSQVQLAGVHNIDWFSHINGVGSRVTDAGDRGTQAYVNFRPETGAPQPGAYAPNAAGIGTLATQADNIGPRLSLIDADRTLGAAGNQTTLACGNSQLDVMYIVQVTDQVNTAATGAANFASSANNPANWAINGRDFGGCGAAAPICANVGWNGTVAGTGASAGQPDQGSVGPTPQAVNCVNNGEGLGSTCTLTIRFINTQAAAAGDCSGTNTSRIFAVDSITLNAAVADDQGNLASVGGRTWLYSSDRNSATQVLADTNGANDGWIRQ